MSFVVLTERQIAGIRKSLIKAEAAIDSVAAALGGEIILKAGKKPGRKPGRKPAADKPKGKPGRKPKVAPEAPVAAKSLI